MTQKDREQIEREPFAERVCPVCGKVFIPAVQHVFKRIIRGKIAYFCGWNCLCKYDKANSTKSHVTNKRAVCQYTADGEFIAEFPTIVAAAEANNTNVNSVRNCCIGYTKLTKDGFTFKYKDKV